MTAASILAGLATADEDVGKAGPIGLFLILSLLIAVFLLGRSMRTHLRRVPLEFRDTGTTGRPPPDRVAAERGVIEGEVLEGEVLDAPDETPSRGGRPDDTAGPDRR